MNSQIQVNEKLLKQSEQFEAHVKILEIAGKEKDSIIVQKDKSISMLRENVTISERKLTNCLVEIKELDEDKKRLVNELNHALSSSKAVLDSLQSKLDESITENETCKQTIVAKDAIISDLQSTVRTTNQLIKNCQSNSEVKDSGIKAHLAEIKKLEEEVKQKSHTLAQQENDTNREVQKLEQSISGLKKQSIQLSMANLASKVLIY